jgi:hypothetical protein
MLSGDSDREVYHIFSYIVGGVASPVLANIVLHELDCWLEEEKGVNPPEESSKHKNTLYCTPKTGHFFGS